MAFCSNCGNGIRDGANFCASCGTGAVRPGVGATMRTAPGRPNRFKPAGIILLIVGAFYLLMALLREQSVQHQLLTAFGATDSTFVIQIVYALANGIPGFFLATSPPTLFLKLNQAGVITFVILAVLVPFLFWIPWVVPAMQEKQ